ncbi:response regulator [Rhizobium sp. CRIBSB]|nr:response regulator [Rhizobium sp. CRIBSB]
MLRTDVLDRADSIAGEETLSRRVVVIDDDDAILESLEALFATAGYQVRAFGSAEAFLAQSGELPPSCIVTDMRMPGTDGLALVKAVRDDLQLSWPIVVISGRADVQHAVTAMQAGAADFMMKPFAPRKLLAKVKALLQEQQAASADIDPQINQRFSTLSARERQVVEHLIAGGSSKTTALALGISPRTVDVFRGKIMRKMGVTNIASLSTAVAAVNMAQREPRKTT